MTRTIRVGVTAADIARGVPCDGTACPVAHAFRRLFPDARMVDVWPSGSWRADVYRPGHRPAAFRLPDRVGDRITAFDLSHAMEPFVFEAVAL